MHRAETLCEAPNNDYKPPRKNTIFIKLFCKYFNFKRSFVFRLTESLHTAILTNIIEAPYLRITPGHYAIMGENDTLFNDREPQKTIPYPEALTYIGHIWEYSPGVPVSLTISNMSRIER